MKVNEIKTLNKEKVFYLCQIDNTKYENFLKKILLMILYVKFEGDF